MAGPNGSGKSTILQEVRKNFYSGPFVNMLGAGICCNKIILETFLFSEKRLLFFRKGLLQLKDQRMNLTVPVKVHV